MKNKYAGSAAWDAQVNPNAKNHQDQPIGGALGDAMGQASQEFAADPCSSMKRGAMVRAARALLSAVTRLLILGFGF